MNKIPPTGIHLLLDLVNELKNIVPKYDIQLKLEKIDNSYKPVLLFQIIGVDFIESNKSPNFLELIQVNFKIKSDGEKIYGQEAYKNKELPWGAGEIRLFRHRDITHQKYENRTLRNPKKWIIDFLEHNRDEIDKIKEKNRRKTEDFKRDKRPREHEWINKYEERKNRIREEERENRIRVETEKEERKDELDAEIITKDPKWKDVRDETDITKIFENLSPGVIDELELALFCQKEEQERIKDAEETQYLSDLAKKQRMENEQSYRDFFKDDNETEKKYKTCKRCQGTGGLNGGCKVCFGKGNIEI